MSKELDALEKVRNRLYPWTSDNQKAFDIIESALKRLEKIDNRKIVGTTTTNKALEQFLIQQCPDVSKKLKALEIIKERFTIQFCKSDLNGYYGIMQIGTNPIYIKTQEEYDLLKEVLL